MIKVKLKEYLEKRNKTVNWLADQLGIRKATLYNFSNNKTESVGYDLLEKICSYLDCQPGDILQYVD